MTLIQVGWRSRLTGEICECPVYERSPHANSDPVYVESPPAEEDDPYFSESAAEDRREFEQRMP